jgi:hypothetical protein
MTSVYRFLPKPLHGYAEDARSYFAESLGIAKNKFVEERPVRNGILHGPTLHAETRDHHLLCVEVAPTYFTQSLTEFVLDCQREGVPVKLYVAVPPDSNERKITDLERAVKNGVGSLHLGNPPTIMKDALSLSLTAVRRPAVSAFPMNQREAVTTAWSTFVNGNPAKGCLEIYELIEAVTRGIATRADKKSCWRKLKAGATSPGLRWEKDPWQNIADALYGHLDAQKLGCPDVSTSLLGRVVGMVEHRNLTGHKPKSVDDLIARDTTLRTRFEHAVDTLRELGSTVRRLHL